MQADKTILVATSDLDVKNNLRSIVEEKGCFTMVLNRGSEVVLAVLEENIDLIILDLDLEGMSGLEVIPIIKKSRPKIPIIVISGDNSIETGSRVLQYGIFYYLHKPINVKEIKEVLEFVPNYDNSS